MSYGPMNPHLLDAMVEGRKKSVLLGYVLWYFLGGIGVHNFYLGKPLLGGLQACSIPFCLVAFSLGETTAILGFVALGVLALSLLVDAFLIPSRARAYSERLRVQLEAEADWQQA
ncbi:MAG TPA: TM2 domain-containing protein [Dongiaceae bacterium]|jgi:TM2 domain-containing membrane protein YozV|nr:TM2 domain-containing protein [Dongiaceae bacterium]